MAKDMVKGKEKGAGIFSIRNATSIKAKIQKVIVLIVAIAMVLLGVVSCYLNYYSTTSSLRMSMEEMAIIAADRVEWQITAYKNVVQELGRTARLANDSYSVEEKQEIIDEKVKAYNCIRGKLIGLDGIALIDGTDYSEREYFQRALQGETYNSEPLIAKTDGSLSLIFAAPVWKDGLPDSEVVGVVFLSMQPELLNDIVGSIYVSENSVAYMINRNGTTVAHSDTDLVKNQNNNIENAKTDSSLSKLASLEKQMTQGTAGFGKYRLNGADRYFSYAPVGNTDNWSLAISTPIRDFLGETYIGIGITVALVLLFISLSSWVAAKIGTSIGAPIRTCAERLNRVLEGDLSSPAPEFDNRDEVGILSAATKGIMDGLNSIIGDIGYLLDSMAGGNFAVTSSIREKYVGDYENILKAMRTLKHELGDTLASIQQASSQVAIGSEQLADSAQSLAEGATDQAGAVEELTATIENVTEVAKQSTAAAVDAYRRVDLAAVEAEEGGKAMQQLTGAMESITATSQEIQNIITTIEDIASQTNLLSLNASIEAARAGEAGRGFAVVAEQIGKLASDSAQSAVDTRELIGKVLAEIDRGNQVTEATAGVLETVTSSMIEFSGLARGASEASEQQVEMLVEVEKGVEQISSVVQSNSAAAEETSATSEELSAQSETMNRLIEKFKF